MLEIARRDILPAVLKYMQDTAKGINSLRVIVDTSAEEKALSNIHKLYLAAIENCNDLEKAMSYAISIGENEQGGYCRRDKVIPAMTTLRATCDALEVSTPKNRWPFPDYGDLLFSIK